MPIFESPNLPEHDREITDNMPFGFTKVSAANEYKNCEDSSPMRSRRKSSTIKHTFTNMIRSSSGSNATTGSVAASPPKSASRSSPSMYNPLMAWGGTPHIFHNSDDYGVAQNEQAFSEGCPALNENDYEEADVESDEDLSESEEQQSYLGGTAPKPVQHLPSGQRYLLDYLSERGFLPPKSLNSSRGIQMLIATSSEVIFLPTINSAQDDEYLSHLALLGGTQSSIEVPSSPQGAEAAATASVDESENPPTVPEAPSLDADGKNVLFNVAVIMSFKKATTISTIKSELHARVRVYWQHGVPPEKSTNEEFYTLGELKWELNNQNYNLYVPRHLSTKNKVIEQPDSISKPLLFQNIADLSGQEYLDKKRSDASLLSLDISNDPQTFQPGEYVFLLPVFFSNNIPESVYLPSGRVNYNFCCATKLPSNFATASETKSDASSSNSGVSHMSEDPHVESPSHLKITGNKLLKKVKDQFHGGSSEADAMERKNLFKGEHQIQVVRIPPVIAESTADKPIYINRIWNDALSYEISLSKKYVPAGSEVPIKIKLAPLTKKVSIKRVRVGILEKITYVSKNLEYEFDQTEAVSNDPYNPYYSEFVCRRKQERILPLWEIRTKEKGTRSMREDIVENCRSENLLSYSSFRQEGSDEENSDVVDSLQINSTLSFPKYSVLDKRSSKSVPPYGIDEFTSVHQPNPPQGYTPRRNSATSGVIGFFAGRRASTPFRSRHNSIVAPEAKRSKTFFKSSSNLEVHSHTRYNEPKRGLYLDCVSMKNMHVKHKLEVMLRISRPDPKKPGAEKHYEVLIDTPIFIVSDLCGNTNIELPTYDMATKDGNRDDAFPPTFEEAVSVPGSPLGSPVNSPMGSPNLVASYEPDEFSIQQLSLSRTTTYNNNSIVEPSSSVPPRSAGRRYSNLDCVMNNSESEPSSTIFREGFQFGEGAGPIIEHANTHDEEEPTYQAHGDPPEYEELKYST